MLIQKSIEIDAGHRVPNHKSKCRNLHGHRYKIEAGVDDKVVTKPGDSSEGMVIDFSDLKNVLVEEIDNVYDHSFIMYEDDEFAKIFRVLKGKNEQKINFVPFIPTAENLAKHFFIVIKAKLDLLKIKLEYIKIYETPTSTATFTEKNYQAII